MFGYMVAGFRDDGMFRAVRSYLLLVLLPSESYSLHDAPRHGAVTISYVHCAFISLLLTHYATTDCATGKLCTTYDSYGLTNKTLRAMKMKARTEGGGEGTYDHGLSKSSLRGEELET